MPILPMSCRRTPRPSASSSPLREAVRPGERDRIGVHAPGVELGAHLPGGEGRAQGLEGRQVGLLQLPEGGGQVAGGLRHPVLEEDVMLAVLDQELAALERALGGEQDLVEVDRLQDEVARALLEALHRHRDVAGAGQHDDRRVGVPGPHVAEQLEAVHARHLEIGDRERRPLAVVHHRRFLPVARDAALVAGGAEGGPKRGADVELVVHDEDAPTAGSERRRGRASHRHAPGRTPGAAPMSSWTETRFLPARFAA